MSSRVPELTIPSISVSSSSKSRFFARAISSKSILRSIDWMMKILLPDLLPTDFTTMSCGRMISFSST